MTMPLEDGHIHLQFDADMVVDGLARRHATRWTDRHREAVVAGGTRRTWTELDDRVTRLADGLAARGVGHGDVVASFMQNRVEFFELVLALASLGAVAAPQSFRSTDHELVHGISATGARLLVAECEGDLGARAERARDEIGPDRLDVIGVGAPGCGFDELLESGAASVPRPRPREHDLFWLALTGGTTGPPKLVSVPHRVIVQMWLYMVVEFDISRRDTMLIAGPLHHGLGFGFALQQLYVGGKVVVLPQFDAAGVLRAIAAERVTVLPAAPAMLNMILDALAATPTDVSSLRSVISAGSPLMTATKERLLAAFPGLDLYEHYGATEAGFFTVLRPEDQLRKNRSCGFAFFGSEVRVTRDDGTDAADGEIGLVRKRGLVQGGGYFGNAAATTEMFQDGWATVGDLGFLDDEGYLHLVDREKDMIVSGGVNIYPGEIEDAIAALPGVSEVAVIGVPDEKWGETVKAFVVTHPAGAIDERAVVAACTERLAAYKRPRLVEFVDTLPKSAAGKVLKRELREREWHGHERSVG